MNMFSRIPADVARIIADMAIVMRNEDRTLDILTTFTTAFALPKTETDAEYRVPVFEGARDIARVSLLYDGEFSKIGAHRYSVFIDIDTPVGQEEYRMHLNEYEDDGPLEVSLQIVTGWNTADKYTNLITDAFHSVYPDGIVYGVSE
ncbi:hypothetical protein ATCV1_Z856R [Acanthocystis turfacea chlorella virus 1]|uniref:Uncharacterized protein Z856R n=1 Tax=Chlorovirus heliozoae TaxID=322019 RepID=A7KAB6_9PHYC|nr:hypothetical protein ATCV1_Z856R [Acanthocystis turfacea chlorella virus 1]ABT16990.1 hypothetical protein ATCV1_Z856R [Acanthocystis turfacea chlorella virus 1]